jgi:ribosomal protein S1
MEEIKRKQQFTAKVLKTTLAGAIVDIGLDKPGIVHISNIQKEPVKKVEDVIEPGQEVNVWVRRIHQDAKHYDLTMIEPLALEWREVKKDMTAIGSVVRIEKFGVFIDIGAERPGLCHISELTYDYIRTPEDAVKVGEEVEVKVLDFNRRKKQIKLSIKAMQEPPMSIIAEEVDKEPVLTAMEIAYRKAMSDN